MSPLNPPPHPPAATHSRYPCSPGRHFVVLGEYDRSSNAEPVQVLSISKVSTWLHTQTGKMGLRWLALDQKLKHALTYPSVPTPGTGTCSSFLWLSLAP